MYRGLQENERCWSAWVFRDGQVEEISVEEWKDLGEPEAASPAVVEQREVDRAVQRMAEDSLLALGWELLPGASSSPGRGSDGSVMDWAFLKGYPGFHVEDWLEMGETEAWCPVRVESDESLN